MRSQDAALRLFVLMLIPCHDTNIMRLPPRRYAPPRRQITRAPYCRYCRVDDAIGARGLFYATLLSDIHAYICHHHRPLKVRRSYLLNATPRNICHAAARRHIEYERDTASLCRHAHPPRVIEMLPVTVVADINRQAVAHATAEGCRSGAS